MVDAVWTRGRRWKRERKWSKGEVKSEWDSGGGLRWGGGGRGTVGGVEGGNIATSYSIVGKGAMMNTGGREERFQ